MENTDKENREVITYKADPKQEPMRLDKFLMVRIENITRNQLQKAIEQEFVLLNGEKIHAAYRIKPGDIVSVYQRRLNRNVLPEAEDIGGLDIRYEDDDVLILFKPLGLVVHPGVGNPNGTLVNGLLNYFGQLPIPDVPANLAPELVARQAAYERAGIVHRIDKNTTGLLAVAKTELGMRGLAKQFFDHTIERRYLALAWGNIDADTGTINAPIARDERHTKLRAVRADGKHAITHFRVLRRFGYVTLVECKLETGRTHQIRVHFNYIGHPLFGDDQYGGNRIVAGTVFSKYKQFVHNCFELMPHQALHAFSLGFKHPRTGEFIYQDCAPPDNFTALIEKWEKYTQNRLSSDIQQVPTAPTTAFWEVKQTSKINPDTDDIDEPIEDTDLDD
jgi:23S rRNA pseudouridine1911/1915/1917 synthase